MNKFIKKVKVMTKTTMIYKNGHVEFDEWRSLEHAKLFAKNMKAWDSVLFVMVKG